MWDESIKKKSVKRKKKNTTLEKKEKGQEEKRIMGKKTTHPGVGKKKWGISKHKGKKELYGKGKKQWKQKGIKTKSHIESGKT